jgi:hypothetical protein
LAEKKAVKSVLEDEITYTEPEYGEDQLVNWPKEGEERTFILRDVVKVTKLITPFSKSIPKELLWQPFAEIHEDDQTFIEELEPDTMKSGTPKSKYANKYYFLFQEKESGQRQWSYFIDGQRVPHNEVKGPDDYDSLMADVTFMTDVNGQPWSDFREFLKMLGANFENSTNFKLGDYISIGDEFTATLAGRTGKTGKIYTYIDVKTLEPAYKVK